MVTESDMLKHEIAQLRKLFQTRTAQRDKVCRLLRKLLPVIGRPLRLGTTEELIAAAEAVLEKNKKEKRR